MMVINSHRVKYHVEILHILKLYVRDIWR